MFHQLLHWRHFYDRSTPDIGLVSDGLFHAFGWFAIVIGLVMLADLVRRSGLSRRTLAGGILVGAGGFQLYDGMPAGAPRRRLLAVAHSRLAGWPVFPPVAACWTRAGCGCCTAHDCSP